MSIYPDNLFKGQNVSSIRRIFIGENKVCLDTIHKSAGDGEHFGDTRKMISVCKKHAKGVKVLFLK